MSNHCTKTAKHVKEKEFFQNLKEKEIPKIIFKVNKINLYLSELTSKGVKYKIIKKFNAKGL